jgi:hypothetical protein
MEEKNKIFDEIEKKLNSLHISIASIDINRPWGGFFVIDEKDAEKFIEIYFPSIDKSSILKGKISPKILIVAPAKKLSWQYHHRRAELWTLISGDTSIIMSDTDEETEATSMKPKEIISIEQGIRHRMVGQTQWGVVAEIWMHTNSANPSNEQDIIRVKDDFGRN